VISICGSSVPPYIVPQLRAGATRSGCARTSPRSDAGTAPRPSLLSTYISSGRLERRRLRDVPPAADLLTFDLLTPVSPRLSHFFLRTHQASRKGRELLRSDLHVICRRWTVGGGRSPSPTIRSCRGRGRER